MKRLREKMHLSDDGFSLVELLVTILVSCVVTAAAAGFLSAGMRYYYNSNAETTLQTESQIAELFVTELLQESLDYRVIPFGEYPTGVDYAVEVIRESTVSVLIFRANQLWFADVDAALNDRGKIESVVAKGKSGAFLADHVAAFSLNRASRTEAVSAIEDSGLLEISMAFQVSGKTYTDKVTISLRNKKKN